MCAPDISFQAFGHVLDKADLLVGLSCQARRLHVTSSQFLCFVASSLDLWPNTCLWCDQEIDPDLWQFLEELLDAETPWSESIAAAAAVHP